MQKIFNKHFSLSRTTLILLVSAFLMAFGNNTFYANVIQVYPVNSDNLAFIGSLFIVFTGALVILLSLVCFQRATKPALIVLLLLSSFAAYFMDSYGTVIDADMLSNALQTNTAEASDLLSWRMGLYFVLLGLLPSLAIALIRIKPQTVRSELLSSAKLFAGALGTGLIVIFVFSNFYASFFREHKILRYYANPTFYIYSAIKYTGRYVKSDKGPFRFIGEDARIPPEDLDRELVIMVVGETARADRFSLNGYSRETNPLLSQEKVINFPDFWSCGTATAVSVPCMFSRETQQSYKEDVADNTSNALDVLKKSGANVVWLDNNSSSKGVADRVEYHDYKTSELNPDCDTECRDIGMLAHLDEYIEAHPKGDILIVLHQMGNHGPAYYKRYPPAFEKYTPVCKSSQLEDCTKEEINNAYDNAILYTDYFLDKVIGFLKRYTPRFETAMFYLSDHGESLGEYDVYLHGLPVMIAPDEQMHVPAVMWFGSSYDSVDVDALKARAGQRYSQDNVFHTLLGLFELQTGVYNPKLDIINPLSADKSDTTAQ
jgi:lipid A ethanolaminephosphotransferase